MEFIRNNLELKITVKRPPNEIYRVFFLKVTRWGDGDLKIKIEKEKKRRRRNIFFKNISSFFCFKSIEIDI